VIWGYAERVDGPFIPLLDLEPESHAVAETAAAVGEYMLDARCWVAPLDPNTLEPLVPPILSTWIENTDFPAGEDERPYWLHGDGTWIRKGTRR
jgi:hypothetical protein